ncbi:MAG: mechanosensitive ion channel [Alphaproteobacteria bacterium]|nr:mechanosensitive ion channel [Alphaproteobacteria bacterium]
MDAAASEIWTEVAGLMTQYGLDVVGAIVVLLIGLWASGWAKRMTIKSLIKVEQVDATLRMFFGSLVKYLVLAFTFIMVLNQFGVQTASLIAIMGAAGLAIGLALQGTLSNVASGVMLLLFRPLNVDQFVNAGGVMGTVKAVNLFTTEVATLDNVQVIVPNSQIWGGTITNYSVYDTRRMDIVMGIGYGNSIDDAMAALRAIYNADDRVMADPEPAMYVTNLGASSVDITVRVWCGAGDFWALKTDLTKAFKEALDAKGIEIPFPQSVVHMRNDAAE